MKKVKEDSQEARSRIKQELKDKYEMEVERMSASEEGNLGPSSDNPIGLHGLLQGIALLFMVCCILCVLCVASHCSNTATGQNRICSSIKY
jgi:hypothetical protein